MIDILVEFRITCDRDKCFEESRYHTASVKNAEYWFKQNGWTFVQGLHFCPACAGTKVTAEDYLVGRTSHD